MPAPRLKLKAETVTAIATTAIGVAAVFIAWDQARVMRAQQQADVWPILQVRSVLETTEDAHSIRIVAQNAGVGPAMIEHVAISADGERLENETALFRDHRPEGLAFPGVFYQFSLDGQVLAAGSEFEAVRAEWPLGGANDTLAPEFWQQVFTLDLSVCYCSIYDRCWTTAMNSLERPQATKSCPKG